MELKIEMYPSDEILGSYEYMFAQYLAGQTGTDEIILSVYIMGEVCMELRRQYAEREDWEEGVIEGIEKEIIQRITDGMAIPEEEMAKIVAGFMKMVKEHRKEYYKNK